MIIYFVIFSGLVAIGFAFFVRMGILKNPQGNEKMVEISLAIQEGSKAYLKRQYKTVSVVAVIIIALLWIFLNLNTAIGFLIGAVASALAGYFGMLTAVMSNSRVAEKARSGIAPAFRLSFLGGSVTGFLVAGLALFVVALFWLITKDINSLIGLGFGGSLISVFSRLGGGIYTKAADVGADLVGKIEAGIPEDDPRNPAVIADNVGDNVGDCAGMAADLFETYAVTTIAAMLLGSLIYPGNADVILLPLILGGIAIIASLISTFFVNLPAGKAGISSKSSGESSIMRGLYKGIIASAVISMIGFWPAIKYLSGFEHWLKLYLAGIIGLVITFLIVAITEYYTSKKFRPVQSIAQASKSGHATNIIYGLSVSMEATVLPIVVITLGILGAYYLFGLYGIAIAAVSMLSLTGIIVAIDSFGPITDNAGGIAEMANLPAEIRKSTDALDAVGNTTKAVTKGYAIGSAGLAALVLFGSYVAEIERLGKSLTFELQNPLVLAGLFIGALLPYLFGALSLKAVGKTAGSIVEEVRRQFREIKGIMTGEQKPDYAQCVDIATRSALKEMVLPAILPILITILVALVFGAQALGGLLIGVIISGLLVAISMTSGGAAWDNAKKFIEEGNHGGKGSFAHQAAVTGDTVGDPYKDTAGPAINPMIKVVNIVALLLIPLLF
ncbi:sodium-translocating pyrophosphatase [Patescibacteria group bacterium]|nr:sodium-translocating pyrophosphatase [Patescibacteria group bacterium]MBU2263444.1 sodium-translocating pyrophosphatase [Patescibacteria group bacterium]